MVYTDPYDEHYISDADFEDPDPQGHLIAEAHRIVAGDSADPPTVEMLAALIGEIGFTRELLREIQSRTHDDIPF
jgi:hypothetical protein